MVTRRDDKLLGPGWLRSRLPTLLFEAGLVVFAILLALAVDEWREDRANRELAARARADIRRELTLNREEVRTAAGRHAALAERLDAQRRRLEAEGAPTTIDVEFSYSLLSSAAWEAARMTRAVHQTEFDWVVEVARCYQVQELFDDTQRGLTDALARAVETGDPETILDVVATWLARLMDIEEGLLRAYDELLASDFRNGSP